MSDLNKTEQRQEETSFINDKIDNLTLKLYDENNSEYEDVEEDECDEIITSIATKSSLKVKIILSYLISFRFCLILDNYR